MYARKVSNLHQILEPALQFDSPPFLMLRAGRAALFPPFLVVWTTRRERSSVGRVLISGACDRTHLKSA